MPSGLDLIDLQGFRSRLIQPVSIFGGRSGLTASQRQLQPYLPSGQEVEDVKQEQEHDSGSLIFDILDFPSKLFGAYSIMGGLEAAAHGGNVGEAMLRGSPFAFLSDALGISESLFGEKTVARKKTMHDVRVRDGDINPDEGWYMTVLDVMGDIAFDPSTWVMPFGVLKNVEKGAKQALKGYRSLEIGDQIAKREMILQTKGIVAGKLADNPQLALSLAQKVESSSAALLVMGIPFTDLQMPIRLMPKTWENRVAKTLTGAADFLRNNVITGPIIRTFSAGAILTDDPLVREASKRGMDLYINTSNGIANNTLNALKNLRSKFEKSGAKIPRELDKTIIDFVEFDVQVHDDAMSILKKYEDGYVEAQRAAAGRKLTSPWHLEVDKASRADLAPATMPGVVPAVPSTATSITGALKEGQYSVAPLEEALVGTPSARAGVLEQAKAERAGRLQELVEVSGATPPPKPGEVLPTLEQQVMRPGDAGLKPYIEYAEGLRDILLNLGRAEVEAGLMNTLHELYFPRVMSKAARQMLNTFLPKQIEKKFGAEGLKVVAPFLEKRTFTDLSHGEVNAIIDALGIGATGYHPFTAIAEMVAEDKSFWKKLKRTDPTATEFFSTDVSWAVYRRAMQSGEAVGKKKMLDYLFDEFNGIVHSVTDTADLASIRQLLTPADGGPGLVPIARLDGKPGYSIIEPATVIEQAVGKIQTARYRAARSIIRTETNARLSAMGGAPDMVLEELRQARDLKPSDALDHFDGELTLQAEKKKLLRRQAELETQAARTDKGGIFKQYQQTIPKRQLEIEARITQIDAELEAGAKAPYRGGKKVDFESGLGREKRRLLRERAQIIEDYKAAKETPEGVAGTKAGMQRDLLKRVRQKIDRINEDIAQEMEHVEQHSLDVTKQVKDVRKNARTSLTKSQTDFYSKAPGASFVDELAAIEGKGTSFGLRIYEDPSLLMGELEKLKGKKLFWVDKEVANGLQTFLHQMHAPDPWRRALSWFDGISDWWKRITVLPFPQSRVRDIVSNASLLMLGGFRHYSAIGETQGVLNDARKFLKGEVATMEEALGKRTIKIADDLTMTGTEFYEAAQAHGLVDSGFLRDEFQNTLVDLTISKKRTTGQVVRSMINPIEALDFQKGSSWWVKKGAEVAAWGDNSAKLAGFLDALRRGMDVEDAAAHVKKLIWSPGSTLHSPGERFYARRAIPFYNWVKHVTGTMVENYIKKPGAFTMFSHIRDEAEKKLGLENYPEDLFAAKITHERLGVPYTMTDKGPVYMLFDGYLPHADVPQIASAILGMIPFTNVKAKESINFFGERLNPIIKDFLEETLNYQFYTEQDIEKFEGEKGEMFGVPLTKGTRKIISDLRFLKTIDDMNLVNLSDFNFGPNANIRGGPTSRTPLPYFPSSLEELFGSQFTTGPLGALPKARRVDTALEAKRQVIQDTAELGKLKAQLRHRIDDNRPMRKMDMETLKKLIAGKQAQLLRTRETADRYGIELETR